VCIRSARLGGANGLLCLLVQARRASGLVNNFVKFLIRYIPLSDDFLAYQSCEIAT